MAGRWEDVEDLLVGAAGDDLEDFGGVQPALVAFAGEALRFIAWLREFDKGAYHDAFVELFALAGPLHADRLAVSISGRAWSLDDPMPPVCAEGDLRQRILMIHFVDGAGGSPRATSVIHPFSVTDGRVRWDARQPMGAPEGWIPQAMELTVERRHRLRAGDRDIAAQAARVSALGHDLHLSPEVASRLLPWGADVASQGR